MRNTYAQKLYKELVEELPSSIHAHRVLWAKAIVEQQVQLHDLIALLGEEHKVSYRFLWLLSNVGDREPQRLFNFLPELFNSRSAYPQFDYTPAFCKYWHLVGIPEEQEAAAMELCFGWLNDPKAKVSFKYYSMWVLHKLLSKYPELKSELIASLERQLEGNTATFSKQAGKILNQLQ